MLGRAFDDVLLAAQAGAAWAYTRLYEDLAGAVTAYLRRQGAHEPDDVTSETFLHVFHSIERFTGDESGFRSWVFTIAHRRLVDERRQRSRRVPTTSLDGEDGPTIDAPDVEDPADATDDTDQLGGLLETLTEAQRDVVLLRIVAGLSVTETAAAVGRTRDAVRQLQRRGLRALEETLRDRAERPGR